MKIDSSTPSRLTLMGLDDRKIIGYRPKLNAEIGSVLSTIVVCQAMYWAQHFGNPFYKFIEPCNHGQYRKGDSWIEELGFTRHEFLFAIKRVAQKVSKKACDIDRSAFIWYWTDMSRVTWYQVNWDRVNEAFDAIYPENPESGFTKIQKVDLCKSGNLQYVNPVSGFSNIEQRLTSEITQKASSSVSREVEGSKGEEADDDDLFRDLIDIGLPPTLAMEVLKNNERVVVEHKLKDMLQALRSGKVGNMTGYAVKVFSGSLYSPKQVADILAKEDKLTKRDKSGHNTKKREREKEMDFSLRWNDGDIEIPELSADQMAGWEKQLYGNKVLWKIYQERGTDSPLVRVSMRSYVGSEA